MDIRIRTSLLNDIPQLRVFEQGVIAAERPFTSALKETEITYYDLENLINSNMSELIVAEIDSQLVGSGYALIKEAKPYEKSECYAYLGFMYVKPEHRRKGINQQIIEALVNWSKEKGVTDIRLDVYQQNESAVKAYEKIGFRPSLVEMRLAEK